MHFLIDRKLKIIFGWSAKCGSSHVKKIFYFLQNNRTDNEVHLPYDYNIPLPRDISDYTTILFIRNPYKRLISGFLDKYNKTGQFRDMWNNWNSNNQNHKDIKFGVFVDELVNNNWKMIDKHHFIPQTKEIFDKQKILRSKKLVVYDIVDIDYDYIEKLYNKIIPQVLLNFRGGHQRKTKTTMKTYVYDLDIVVYFDYTVPTEYFYNQDIKDKVYSYYINDFSFFNDHGYRYLLDC